MNLQTGQVKSIGSFKNLQEAEDQGYLPVAELAKPSCRQCNGTGIKGWTTPRNKSQRQPVICRCVYKGTKRAKEKAQKKFIEEAQKTLVKESQDGC